MNMNKQPSEHERERLGVDVGGVIIDRAADDTDTSFFSDNYLRTPAVRGAFSSLRRLVDDRFGTHVFLISKCGANVERKTREWLDHRRFYGRTGVPRENVRFCRQRWEKANVCHELGITHFVDDRLEVLGYLGRVPNRFLFRPDEEEVQAHADTLGQVRRVESWLDVLRALLSD